VKPKLYVLALPRVLHDEVVDLAVCGLTADKAILRLNRAVPLRPEPPSKIATLADVHGLANKRDHVYAGPVEAARDREPAERAGAVIVASESASVAIPGLRHKLADGSA